MIVPERIRDLIDVPPVRTVIRLEDGRESAREIASSFVFTPEVSAHLTVLSEALRTRKGQGYFLQGDFGSGKSHFLAAAYAWLAGREGGEHLGASHEGMRRLAAEGARFLPVAVSLVGFRGGTSLERIVLASVEEELRRAGQAAPLTPLVEQVDRQEAFVSALEAVLSRGYAGLVLLVDELSEFLRSKPSSQALNDDARTLQLLGELAGARPLWVVAAVQESIERTGDVAQSILRKIKDRYPVRLALSTMHIRSIISGRLVRKKPGAEKVILRIHETYRSLFPGFTSSYEELLACYPVHPQTIALLDGLGDLFSQHRGIVDFVHARIAGDEARGIPSILDRPAVELLGPDSIYEHFAGRLAEVSAFYVYPRHIVPHLDEVIGRVLGEEADRALARRLVRMLVLFRIHPTAEEPPCARLAELAACSLDFGSLDMSARFVAEAILDPLVAASRFLVRTTDPGGEPARAVYAVVTQEDPGKVLGERIRRVAAEIQDDDNRLLTEPLAALSESEAWPGRGVMERGVEREVGWNLSTRKVLVLFAHPDDHEAALARLVARTESAPQGGSGALDFAVLLELAPRAPQGSTAPPADAAAPHVAVWEIRPPEGERLGLLKEHLAARTVHRELRPSNPAEAPLIQPAREAASRLEPGATQAALECLYAGRFRDGRMRVDPAVRQLRRFDRLTESAGEILLADRYPKFAGVAPRRFPPSPRVYQQLLEAFVIPGSVSLADARARSLAAAIDGLAVPLGLVEVRRGSYVYSPDARGHPLLAHLFAELDPTSAVALPALLGTLERGPFGLPHDTALFLLASLMAGGLVLLRKKGRSIPLEFLTLSSVESADEVALGELLPEADRRALPEECPFLFPTPPEGPFGLKQQRDAWKEAIRFRASAESTIRELASRLERLRGFASLAALDAEEVSRRVEALAAVKEQIKVSYAAKEGLERFLEAWRGSGLHAQDVESLRALSRFLSRSVDEFIFVSHYARHQAVVEEADRNPDLASLRARLVELIEDPTHKVVPDNGEALRALFAEFREHYTGLYAERHAEANRGAELAGGRDTERSLGLLRSLGAVPGLDRPPGLVSFLERVDAAARRVCRRHVAEELLRAPVCGCGFRPSAGAPAGPLQSAEESIGGFLGTYLSILRSPPVLEALAARSFGLRDAEPATSARLDKLRQAFAAPGLAAAHLPDLLDSSSCRHLGDALSRKLDIRPRNLADLVGLLAGRRMEPAQLLGLVRQWLGDLPESALVAVEAAPGEGSERTAGSRAPADAPVWWSALHPELFGQVSGEGSARDVDPSLRALESILEERYPHASLLPALERLDTQGLVDFLCTERFHTRLLQEAWVMAARRTLEARPGAAAPWRAPHSSLHADPAVARALDRRIELLDAAVSALGRELPRRLEARIGLEQLARDAWAGEELRATCRGILGKTEELGAEWLRTLKRVDAIDLEDGPLVLILDAAPADVWVASEETALAALRQAGGEHTTSWNRLDAEPSTPEAVATLLGLEGSIEPAEALGARGGLYATASGDETRALLDVVGPLPELPGTPVVIRLAALDRRAHAGEATLADLAALLRALLSRHIGPLLAFCRTSSRRLVLTTDHGLSLARGHLVHGKGGPFEQAIFRLEWRP